MDSTRGPRRGRIALQTVLGAVKVGVLAVLLAGPTAGVVQSAAPGPDAGEAECAPGSLDTDRPAPALIRTDEGRVRQVSFDVAWDVYKGRRPGTVVAICVDGSGRG